MITFNDYVNRKGTTHPTGLVQGVISKDDAIVRWGIDRGIAITEQIPIEDLTLVEHEIFSPDEILRRECQEK